MWPSELLLPILSTLNSHLFTEKKSKTQLTTDHLNFQNSLIVSKNRKIETFTGRSHHFTTIPTVRSFFRQHLPWQRAWLADAKAPVSERQEVWGRFHSFGAPQTIPNLMFVRGSGWARAFLLTEIRGELRFFGAFFCTYVTFRGGVGWNSNVHHTAFLTRRSWLFLPPFLGLGEVGWSNNVLWHLHSRDATSHVNL